MITDERQELHAALDGRLDRSLEAVESLRAHLPELECWGRRLATVLTSGGRLLAAGNGGSAAQVGHLVAELVGRFEGERRPLPALSLMTDAAVTTALGNDYGYDEMVARQVAAHSSRGDVVFLLSTSGRSPNLLRAVEAARRAGAETWAMTGPGPNPLAGAADRAIPVAAAATPHVQEGHQVAIHLLCTVVDAEIGRGSRTLPIDGGFRP
jgi:phosphoheptose isomerase